MAKTGPQRYPGANTSYWYGSKYVGAAMEVNVAVWHTTEGTTVPTYGDGAAAPTLTVLPDFPAKRLRWYQHFDIDQSARALVDRAGGITTNRNNACQIELVGTCDPATHQKWQAAGRQHIYWPAAPDWALAEVGKFVRWLHEQHGVPMRSTVTWRPYPSSYGVSAPQRLSAKAFNEYTGHLGHQHVPEGNDHGDPGSLNFARVLEHAKGGAPPKEEDDMPSNKEIAEAVWRTDDVIGIPAAWRGDSTNEFWTAQSVLINLGDRVRSVEAKLDKLLAALAADKK
ncbi:hypothetical protein AB0F42_24505 [Streptomyces buecherae]|uniref:hypothetical protein n=1 Tax=Streptomyces buecherae TaxID=2763006 RepID=UPI0033CE0272